MNDDALSMETLKIESTKISPLVILDKESNIMEISGRSLSEDVNTFFAPVINWIQEYALDPLEVTVLNIKLSYFNTASSKVILDMLFLLEGMMEDGHKVLVRWHSPADDEDMMEAGERYSEMVDIPFEMVSYG